MFTAKRKNIRNTLASEGFVVKPRMSNCFAFVDGEGHLRSLSGATLAITTGFKNPNVDRLANAGRGDQFELIFEDGDKELLEERDVVWTEHGKMKIPVLNHAVVFELRGEKRVQVICFIGFDTSLGGVYLFSIQNGAIPEDLRLRVAFMQYHKEGAIPSLEDREEVMERMRRTSFTKAAPVEGGVATAPGYSPSVRRGSSESPSHVMSVEKNFGWTEEEIKCLNGGDVVEEEENANINSTMNSTTKANPLSQLLSGTICAQESAQGGAIRDTVTNRSCFRWELSKVEPKIPGISLEQFGVKSDGTFKKWKTEEPKVEPRASFKLAFKDF